MPSFRKALNSISTKLQEKQSNRVNWAQQFFFYNSKNVLLKSNLN